MRFDMSGKVVLITGGAGCIGSDTSRVFAQNGATVYINDVDKTTGEALEAEINEGGGKAVFIRGSVMSSKDMEDFVGRAYKDTGKIDILVNNSGYNVNEDYRTVVADYDQAEWNKVMGICLDGLHYCTKNALPVMKAQKAGRIVNIASVGGWRAPLRLQSAYCAAKAAILNMSRTMSIEYGEYGINVNVVIPGSILSPFIADVIWKQGDMMAHIPLNRGGSGVDIGNAVMFLCSEGADYITGAELNVDGGWAAGYAL